MADEEDKYIKQSESDQISRIRRERQLTALRTEEREGIASVLQTSEDIASEALDLGFDRETARILHLVPIIQVAWADNSIQDEERTQILGMAASRGISGGAMDFLELLLDQRPSDLFFERTNKVLAHILASDETGRESDDLLEQARAVAGASGGILGFRKVSPDERALLDDLEKLFGRNE